ncbi:hydrogen peroxide-inducible genes activator [Devosia algicola]|uniref:Hydrogen peroxide-inducible genes activator n=1 Tax=Devosia algicola TaxID=3026418 RepID=A0ABY7YR87_9HYPH|nr:hydrogen peroxide-inducible genes activator [Devosia algicola]WDR03848.1 hydrogen peroxide-inducible genes activator [Devosia algicola]
MTLSLKQFRYAIAIAETGHFGRAAVQCHISQPAMSQQIQLIEAQCGTLLFDRSNRAVQLTPFGREFIDRAQQVIEAADAVEAFVAGQDGSPHHPIRFGLIPTVAPYLLPDIFPALADRLPGVKFMVSESRTDALLTGLYEGNVDLALIATEPPENGPALTSAPLFLDPFVLATAANQTSSSPIALADVAPETILLLDEGHCLRDQAIAACHLDGTGGGRTFAATSLSTIVEFVAHGQGVTLLPRISLRKETASARIAIHELEAPGAGRQLLLVWRQATPFATVFHQIAETIRETRPPPT